MNIKMNISRFHHLIFLTLLLFNVSCFQEMENDDQEPVDNGPIILKEAFPNLTFNRPVDFQHAGDRIFIVEQRGLISVFQNDIEVEEKSVFLNIESRVNDQGNEEGLLGLAFHPDYENNGFFFVNYTAASPRRTVVSRFQVSASDPNRADENSELVILEIPQPFSNHNGGQLSFGPDGYLYIASGDGGSGGDPQNHGQRLETLLGAILRIDIDAQDNGRNYAIPADNPFVNNQEGFKEEIYAYGLRNPWRFSFDSQTDALWTADVGQNRAEEIDIITKGGNYGWRTMEGFNCFNPSSGCNQEGLILPIWEYTHTNGDRSVTGGFVYSGTEISELQGLYVYADFVSGRIWTLDFSDLDKPINTELMKANFSISSFGIDQSDELFLCGFDEKIYKFGYE
ncbi:Glucose / Sorbosone dehydrogenase [Aquiflexum balticum DSM 16537]|uniref:Glucose / Sorbosone dehydrogenase n=1 Tax=Aquiflexum balticum DSM 16537 TaxID=758820 RepID=A0A1W2H6F2_9BACT|nr:PQQ-dependent sugar dehydrogenase [Aquiflexum balticum]SMD44461.1 Glucose / Sorbosone dehydrogenase [Aquiflexum balticum DSM 16537]